MSRGHVLFRTSVPIFNRIVSDRFFVVVLIDGSSFVLLTDLLHRKDDQILTLLQEKSKLFQDMCGSRSTDDVPSAGTALFRSCSNDRPKGDHLLKDAIGEGNWSNVSCESLELVSCSCTNPHANWFTVMRLVTCLSLRVCVFFSGDAADAGARRPGRGRGTAGAR